MFRVAILNKEGNIYQTKSKYALIDYVQQFKEFTNGEQEEVMNKMLDDIIFEICYVYGTSGIGVKRIQKILNLWLKKYFPIQTTMTVNGQYNTYVKEVVEQFQKETGLLVDGKAGKQTMTELLKFLLDRVEYYK